MKLAHLILAHAYPEQLARLIDRLSSERADIYIQLDKKSDIANFDLITGRNNVFFIYDRIDVYWGTYSIVQATLNGFREILDSGKAYSHINLLSAQDYPLKPVSLIEDFLFNNSDKTFMHSLSIEHEWQEALDRVRKYNFGDYRIPGHYMLQHLLVFLQIRRRMPAGLIPYGRSQWLTVTPECATYILYYLKENPTIKRYFRMSFAPDEFIFQTILCNSPLKHKLVNDNLRYIDFTRAGYHPKTLNMTDAEALTQSVNLFARKFDMRSDADILNYLDWIINAHAETDEVYLTGIKTVKNRA